MTNTPVPMSDLSSLVTFAETVPEATAGECPWCLSRDHWAGRLELCSAPSSRAITAALTRSIPDPQPQQVTGAWQPIETAPFDQPLLVFGLWKPSFIPQGEGRFAVWERDSRGPADDFYSDLINGDATHWRPLPEPPETPK